MKYLRFIALSILIASSAWAVDNQVYVLNQSSNPVTVTLLTDNTDSSWTQSHQGKKYDLEATTKANGDKNWIHAGGNGILGFTTSDGLHFNAPGAPLTAPIASLSSGSKNVVLSVTFSSDQNGRTRIESWQTANDQGQGDGSELQGFVGEPEILPVPEQYPQGQYPRTQRRDHGKRQHKQKKSKKYHQQAQRGQHEMNHPQGGQFQGDEHQHGQMGQLQNKLNKFQAGQHRDNQMSGQHQGGQHEDNRQQQGQFQGGQHDNETQQQGQSSPQQQGGGQHQNEQSQGGSHQSGEQGGHQDGEQEGHQGNQDDQSQHAIVAFK